MDKYYYNTIKHSTNKTHKNTPKKQETNKQENNTTHKSDAFNYSSFCVYNALR